MNDERTSTQSGGRQERRDALENRKRILATARQLFATQGVDSTSMNQIAQATQVGPGTLYRHFSHKGDLCAALLADDIAAFQERVTVLIMGNTGEAAVARLEQVLEELMRMTEAHIPLLTAMQEAGGMRRHDAFQNPLSSWLYIQMTSLLRDAVAQGEIADLDVEFTVDAILAAIAPPLFVFQQQQRGFSRERIIAGVRRLFIDGLYADVHPR